MAKARFSAALAEKGSGREERGGKGEASVHHGRSSGGVPGWSTSGR